MQAEGEAADAYASADQAVTRIEKQLRRYHRRIKDHRADAH
jgi:ribosome-associated translation inhibitor RaiA